MSNPKSFSHFGRDGRRYRCYFNQQRGHWYAAYHDGQDRLRVTLNARTKPEAEHAVRLLDTPKVSREEKVERITFVEFQRRYLEFKTEQGKAERSVERFKAGLDALGRYLKTKGIVYVDQLSLTILEGYIPYRTKVEKRGEKTAYTDALAIKNAMKWGSRTSRGLLKVNPALEWETKEPVRPKRRTYTADEVAKLESGVRKWLQPVVTVLAWSGMRIGELVNLRWADVDFDQHVLHVRIKEDWKPKGRADRVVPLHPKVEAILRQQRVGEYVFTGKLAGRLRESLCLAALKTDQRKLKLPESDLHGFRRFFATSMMQAGVSVETVRQWGGWKSLETMQRYLADVSVKESVQAMAQAAQRLATA